MPSILDRTRREYFSTVSFDEKWQEMTHNLLEAEVGSYTNAMWNQADQVLKQKLENEDADIAMVWKILDRLAQEAEIEKELRKRPRLKTMEILNPILKHWKQSSLEYYRGRSGSSFYAKDDDSSTPPLPSEIHKRIEQYQAANLFHHVWWLGSSR